MIKKVDSFPRFPHMNAVQQGTETCLTSEFEMGSGGTRPLWPSYDYWKTGVYKDFWELLHPNPG